MTRLVRTLSCALILAAPLAGAGPAQPVVPAAAPIAIVVSIDGWRWDYVERYRPPTISALAARGVRAEGLIPVFPSKTFPNHYSILTGLYPARHGIVSNNMADPHLPGRFTLDDHAVQQDTRWWGGEPLWITAERQGLLSATMFWPGSDAEIAGRRPRYWRTFDDDLPNEARVDQLLEWLRTPEPARPTFLTLYFSTVDTAGHDYGPESPELAAAVRQVDAAIARLAAGVDAAGLAARTHFVLVSDHGMAALSPDRVIVLDDYLDMSTVLLLDSSPIAGISRRPGVAADPYAALKDKHPAMKVYTPDTLPAAMRLAGHPRLPDVIGVADDGWHVTTRRTLEREHGEVPGGTHGYDPVHRSMHGLFVAAGPRFRQGIVVPRFEVIHVYEMLCRLLGLQPASNDGDRAVTTGFFR